MHSQLIFVVAELQLCGKSGYNVHVLLSKLLRHVGIVLDHRQHVKHIRIRLQLVDQALALSSIVHRLLLHVWHRLLMVILIFDKLVTIVFISILVVEFFLLLFVYGHLLELGHHTCEIGRLLSGRCHRNRHWHACHWCLTQRIRIWDKLRHWHALIAKVHWLGHGHSTHLWLWRHWN